MGVCTFLGNVLVVLLHACIHKNIPDFMSPTLALELKPLRSQDEPLRPDLSPRATIMSPPVLTGVQFWGIFRNPVISPSFL